MIRRRDTVLVLGVLAVALAHVPAHSPMLAEGRRGFASGLVTLAIVYAMGSVSVRRAALLLPLLLTPWLLYGRGLRAAWDGERHHSWLSPEWWDRFWEQSGYWLHDFPPVGIAFVLTVLVVPPLIDRQRSTVDAVPRRAHD